MVGTTYWITGLSGAGKTTVGKMLYKYLKEKESNVVLLDGDVLRQVYQSDDYSQAGRIKLAYQHARLCKMLNEQGIDVIICLIAMYQSVRNWNRENIESYREIYLNVSVEELIKRDQKGLYSRALRGEIDNVMGINMKYEAPEMPDLEIMNYGELTPDETVKSIIDKWKI